MPNKLTADDATFASTVGNWQAATGTTLSRQTTPTSPDGNNVGRLQRTGSPGDVGAAIPRGIYPVALGDPISMELAYNVPGTISGGSGTLFCQIAVNVYQANPAAAGVSMGLETSDPFVKGSGWHQLVIPEFTVGLVGGVTPAWVGVSVRFDAWTGSSLSAGDIAYFSDVYVGEASPVAVGGWGVGMVRMGLN
jgi:hypothetical protein